MIHFKELRSGKDMAYLMRRAIKHNTWSNGASSRHLVNRQVFENSSVTVYDYDLRVECLLVLLAFFMLIKAIFSGSSKK